MSIVDKHIPRTCKLCGRRRGRRHRCPVFARELTKQMPEILKVLNNIAISIKLNSG